LLPFSSEPFVFSSNVYVKIIKYTKSIISPVVLVFCGYETWSLALREEYGLKVCGDTVLKTIFEPNREELMGGWRELHNEELHNLYSSPNTI
jgi:hypothetical protein